MTAQAPYSVRHGYCRCLCQDFHVFAEAVAFFRAKCVAELRGEGRMDLPTVLGENHDDERDGLTEAERGDVDEAFSEAVDEARLK